MLALGARGVLLDRAYIYALAASGQRGVAHLLALIAEEMRVTMALIGAKSVHEITRDSLVLAEKELAAEAKAPQVHPGHAAGSRMASRN
jgi:L-lactate dehydrogenase (cytochrome)